MNTISPEQQTVLVDMDGVLADFNGNLYAMLSASSPEVVLPERQTEFYLDHMLPPEHRLIVKEIISQSGFFIDLEPIDGAKDGWAKLLELGYLPRVCSAPLRKNETSVPDKKAWLEEHFVPLFGSSVIDLAIFDKQKWLHPGIALIDDRPDPNYKNYQDIRAAWQHIVYDYPYNALSNAPHRMMSWQDPLLPTILSEIAADK
jgi:5'-nucleotidase